ncbi:MAG: hypothetical protein M1823_000604 [Watsoniomyces obsoletus]|nr:MAG: hypothetical protein M1823_000604 [Watsoniomyces obsoletus]
MSSQPPGPTKDPDAARREELAKAALMADLGRARRNNLALEGTKKHVDFEQIEKTKRVHQVGSDEWHEAQKAAAPISAWKSLAAAVDSDDDEDLESDMGYGQSHRAALIESQANRGRGRGRGGSFASTRKAQETRNRANTTGATDSANDALFSPGPSTTPMWQTPAQPQKQPATSTSGTELANEGTGHRRRHKHKRRGSTFQSASSSQGTQQGESHLATLGQQKAPAGGRKSGHARKTSLGKKPQHPAAAQTPGRGKEPQTPGNEKKPQTPGHEKKPQTPASGKQQQQQSLPKQPQYQPLTPMNTARPSADAYPKLANPKDFLAAAGSFHKKDSPGSTTTASMTAASPSVDLQSGNIVPRPRVCLPPSPFTRELGSATKGSNTADLMGINISGPSSSAGPSKMKDNTASLFELANAPGFTYQSVNTEKRAETPSPARSAVYHEARTHQTDASSEDESSPVVGHARTGQGKSPIIGPVNDSPGHRGRSMKKKMSTADLLGLYGESSPDSSDMWEKRMTMKMFGISDESDLDALNDALNEAFAVESAAAMDKMAAASISADQGSASEDHGNVAASTESILDREEPALEWNPTEKTTSTQYDPTSTWAGLLTDWFNNRATGKTGESATEGEMAGGDGKRTGESSATMTEGGASQGEDDGQEELAASQRAKTTTGTSGGANQSLGSRSSLTHHHPRQLTSLRRAYQAPTNISSKLDELASFFRDAQPGRFPGLASVEEHPHLKLPAALSIPLDESMHAHQQRMMTAYRASLMKPAPEGVKSESDNLFAESRSSARFKPTPMRFPSPAPPRSTRAYEYFGDDDFLDSGSGGDTMSTKAGSVTSFETFDQKSFDTTKSGSTGLTSKVRSTTTTTDNGNNDKAEYGSTKERDVNKKYGSQESGFEQLWEATWNPSRGGRMLEQQSANQGNRMIGGGGIDQTKKSIPTTTENKKPTTTEEKKDSHDKEEGAKESMDPMKAISKGGLSSSRWAH